MAANQTSTTARADSDTDLTATRAVMSTADQNDLPDDAFAYVEPGEKDAEGRTVPRSKRHLPYKHADGSIDKAHLRNALARLSQTQIPEAAKASALRKLKAAAKQAGIEVSDDTGRAVGAADVTRDASASASGSAGDVLVEPVFVAPITRVDPEKRLVTVTATSEAKDSFKTRFNYEASKDAFTRWIGNVREMHQPKAVGTRVAVHCDDEARRIAATIRISKGAQDTWEKILDGTLKGASIGASNVVWEHARDTNSNEIIPTAKKYDLVELSLVDNPSNPDALGITVVRNAVPDSAYLDEMTPDDLRASSKGGSGDTLDDSDTGPDYGGGDEDEENENEEGEGEEGEEGKRPFPGATAPFKKGGKGGAAAKRANARETGRTGNRQPAHAGDVFAHPAQSGVEGDELPEDALFEAEPEDAKSALDADLRPVALDGAGSVPPMGTPAGDVNKQLHELGGPPANPSEQILAASRPHGVLGSEVRSAAEQSADGGVAPRSRALADRVEAFAENATRASAPQIAPQGYGAAASPTTHNLSLSRQMRDAQKREQLAAEEAVRVAGERAIAGLPAWTPDEDYPTYIVRVNRVRGAAERAELERQQAAKYPRDQQQAQQGLPPAQATRRSPWQPPHSAAAQQTAQAVQVAQATRVAAAAAAAVVESTAVATVERCQAPGCDQSATETVSVRQSSPTEPEQSQTYHYCATHHETLRSAFQASFADAPETVRAADMNSAIVQTAPMASSPASLAAPSMPSVGAGRQAHSHNHAHNGALVHGADGSHEHEHTHQDGSTHSHAHTHDHRHHDHHGDETVMRAAGGGAGAAAGGHSHDHSHLHDHGHFYRAGQPLDTALLAAEVTREQSGIGHSVGTMSAGHKTMGLDTLTAPAAPGTLRPVSGSAQSAVNGQPKSPQMSVHPQQVGQLDLLNTEDANAIGFGVPAEVVPVPTPADGEVTAPAGFHEGGHSGDLSHPAPLSPANNAIVGEEGPRKTAEIPHGTQDATSRTTSDDDLDHDADEDAREREAAGGGRSTMEPEETRVGARISAESRLALHTARDGMQASMQGLCEHCGCDECTAKLDALASAADAYANPTGSGERLADGPAEVVALQRVVRASVERALAGQVAYIEQMQTTLTEALGAILTRLADMELTIADLQRNALPTATASVTRAALREETGELTTTISNEIEHRLSSVVETRLAPAIERIAQSDQRLEAVAAAAAGLTADVARIGETVAAIAQGPAFVPPPQQFAITGKSVPFTLPIDGNGQVAEMPDDQRQTLLDALGEYAKRPEVRGSVARQQELSRLAWQIDGLRTRTLIGSSSGGR